MILDPRVFQDNHALICSEAPMNGHLETIVLALIFLVFGVRSFHRCPCNQNAEDGIQRQQRLLRQLEPFCWVPASAATVQNEPVRLCSGVWILQ